MRAWSESSETNRGRAVGLALGVTFVLGCAHPAPPPRCALSSFELAYLGDLNLPPRATAPSSPSGPYASELSALHYDAATNHVWALSDERGPAWLFELELDFGARSARVLRSVELRGPGGAIAPNTIDPEGLARGADGTWWVASEGNSRGAPELWSFASDGRYRNTYASGVERMDRLGSPGCRPNRCFESLALTPSGSFLWSALELPDGSWGALDPDRSTPTQLFRWRVDGAQLTPDRRVSYPLEAAPKPLRGLARERENGLVELLALADDHLLALERGVALGPGVNVAVRLFEVTATESAGKRLALDLGTLAPRLTPPRLDNYEGMSWGPPSPRGHRTLLLVSDDNASSTQRTSFVWLELAPRTPLRPALGHAPAATPIRLRH